MNTRIYHTDGVPPPTNHIFVFGSNLSGIHGAGAAKAAFRHYGAIWGMVEGLAGRTYALPTVKRKIAGPLPLSDIQDRVERFIGVAKSHSHLNFFVTRVGCGLAGYADADIAPMFKDAPVNCSFPYQWEKYLEE